jgi:hypothetical protein
VFFRAKPQSTEQEVILEQSHRALNRVFSKQRHRALNRRFLEQSQSTEQEIFKAEHR